MVRYVLGFLFDPRFREVVLIDKLRPDYQAGLLNGVGGKIEEGESPIDAMRREFKEECGIGVNNWVRFGVLSGQNHKIYLYAATGDVSAVKQITDERPIVFYVDFLPARTVSHVRWLVHMALESMVNPQRDYRTYEIEDKP